MASVSSQRKTIPLWKLIGGAAVHGVVPAYLLALGVDGWLHGAGGVQPWLARVPGFSLWFLGLYGGVGAVACAIAALAEPRRQAVSNPDHLREALAQGRGMFGPLADAALERIAALRPDAGDEAVGRLLRDLAAMVAAGRGAMRGPGDHADMRAITATAIERIAGEVEALARAEGLRAQDKARIMAAYVEQRYGSDGI